MATVREATFELLRRHGLTTVFGNPGSNELLFLKDFPEDFDYVLALHEGAAVAMADGFAQATGHAAFVNLHAAAGTGNGMGVLTNSVYSKSPLVITAGQQVRATVGQEVMLANVDASLLTRPLTKWSAEPLCADDVPRTLSQAIHLASLPAPGPVYVSVPYDDWDKPAPAETSHLTQRHVVSDVRPSDEMLNDLLVRLEAAERPVLVLGPDVDAERANEAAVRVAEALGAPVWIAPSPARCPFPTTHPGFLGVLPADVTSVREAFEGHDLVLVVGAPVFRYHHHRPGAYLPPGICVLQVSGDPSEIARAPFGDGYLAPVGATLSALAEVVGHRGQDATAAARRPAVVRGADRVGAMHPDTVFATIAAAAPDDVVYVNESTSTAQSFWQHARMVEPGSFYSPASGGLGFGLPAAVGVQLAHPERRVVATIGDGSANFGITALWTAARYHVPVIFVILNNGTYGALRRFTRHLDTGETPGLDVPGISFTRLAEGYDVPSERVDNVDDLANALTKAFAGTSPVLIEAITYFD
ncbi:benzoylformate decarboxylase [Terrabacter sp. Ter38]|uniref:benzoylformate decarboxylase n=1 Tax=Terrabacter sp. Ter38 TaxID=2926030 RepID=UPI002118BC71|nr:benzoylformate decarboxylase [Terrabacter sp. Ter38]